jgi:hypothetical protein
MPRLFARSSTPGRTSRSRSADDNMTLGDRSMSEKSVSDRIMGRMKLNLTFLGIGGGSGAHNVVDNDTGSVVDSLADTVESNGASVSTKGGRLRRNYEQIRMRGTSSIQGVDGIRRRNYQQIRSKRSNYVGTRMNGATSTTSTDEEIPLEYSLKELRSMNENELRIVMSIAGVESPKALGDDDVASVNDEKSGGNVGLSSRRTKNSLVRLLVESGRVKLVPDGNTTNHVTTTKPEQQLSVRQLREAIQHAGLEEEARGMTEKSELIDLLQSKNLTNDSQIKTASETETASRRLDSFTTSVKGDDAGSDRSSMSRTPNRPTKTHETTSETRMSKLEKIAELKIENSNIKMENKSLKKTVKKLLGQLTNANTEKNELIQSSRQQYSGDDDNSVPKDTPPLCPIEEMHVRKVEGNSVLPRYLDETDETEGTVPASCEIDIDVLKNDSKAEKRLTMDSSASTESITQLRQKLKKEEQAHKSTEYRLKAEIDILTNEVTGLQRELGLALRSLDDAKERIRGSRESTHGLKREIRVVTARLKESVAEAEARDRLIDTFKGILLQKVGLDPANV